MNPLDAKVQTLVRLIIYLAAANEKLLLAILEKQNVKVDHDEVGSVLGVSGSAVIQHLQKLRRKVKSKNGDGDSGSNEASGAGGNDEKEDEAPKKKRKTVTPRKPRATPAKGKGKGKKGEEAAATDPVTPVKREREETAVASEQEGTLTSKPAGRLPDPLQTCGNIDIGLC